MTVQFNPQDIRKEFPNLHVEVHGKPLVYFDNGASAQTHINVIKRIERYYSQEYSNVHRGIHFLSNLGTDFYEQARKNISQYINANHENEVIFTKGTTESINLLARTLGEELKNGDIILLTHIEHHANIVPWQMLRSRLKHKGIDIELQFVPLKFNSDAPEQTQLNEEWLKEFIATHYKNIKLFSFSWASNALGIIQPAQQWCALAQAHGILTHIDAAQYAPHRPINVQNLGVDFLSLSGHKCFGPMGSGILFGKEKVLNSLPPFIGGGDMIDEVNYEDSTFAKAPLKFEAGTPNVPAALGLDIALGFINNLDHNEIAAYEHSLYLKLISGLKKIKGLEIYAHSEDLNKQLPLCSFNIKGLHPNDLGTLLDRQGFALRTGHHCTQPLMKLLGIGGTLRASLALYNTEDEVEGLFEGLERAVGILN